MTVTRPPFDPELYAALATTPAAPLTQADIPERRAAMAAQAASIDTVIAGTGFEHQELTVPGPSGAPDITLAVVRDPKANSPRPCIYFTHGGGMMFGDRGTGADNFAPWIAQLGVTVVSVEYRLAPEHPFPAGVEDCYAGLVWSAEHADELGIAADRLIVAGGSAGGGLTAAITLMARDRHGPALLGQLLTSPMLDDRVDTTSARQFEQTPAPWSGHDDVVGWTALLGDARGTADVSPYAAPARATDLSRLPSTYVEAGSAEVFRDEDVAYASRIWAAGGQAELHVWAGAYHGFGLVPHAHLAQESTTSRINWMRRLLDGT